MAISAVTVFCMLLAQLGSFQHQYISRFTVGDRPTALQVEDLSSVVFSTSQY